MRIYTEAWNRLKVAAQEIETKKAQELPHKSHDRGQPERDKPSEAPAHKKGPRVVFITIAVFAVVSILSVTFWMGLQQRLVIAATDATDPKTHLELLQGRVKSLEEERQRLANENARLSMQNEQRVIEVARLVEELEILRSQKEPKSHWKQSATPAERPREEAPGAPKDGQESTPVKQGQVKGSNQGLEGSVQKAAKVSAID